MISSENAMAAGCVFTPPLHRTQLQETCLYCPGLTEHKGERVLHDVVKCQVAHMYPIIQAKVICDGSVVITLPGQISPQVN